MTTSKKQQECKDCNAEIESAWDEETKTLRQTIRIYFPPASVSYKPRRERPSKPRVYTPEEIATINSERRLANAQPIH